MAKVLVVDDDPDMVEACRLILEGDGYEVSSALNREDGMKMVDTFAPDLLVLDVMMAQPDDGIAMAQELRRKGFTKPIVMLTSIGKVTGMDYGQQDSIVPVDAFLEKPTDAATLRDKVKELLAK